MIKYRLKCAEGHQFDAWFNSMADYDAKAQDKAVACVECGDTDVAKAIMAPNVAAQSPAAQPAPAPVAPCGMPGGGCGAGMCGIK